MSRAVTTSATDQSIRVWAYNSSGAAITGEAYNSAGIAVSVVVRSAGRIVSTTALTLVARSGAGVHTDSAFTEVGAGEYVVDLPDSYFATAGRQVSVTLTSDAISGGYVLSETLAVGQAVELDPAARVKLDADQPDYHPATTTELEARTILAANYRQNISLRGTDMTEAKAFDLLLASLAGVTSQPSGTTEKFKFLDGNDAFTTTFDTNGNRTGVALA